MFEEEVVNSVTGKENKDREKPVGIYKNWGKY